MKGNAQPGTADAAAAQLRELLGEARGTVRDLTVLLRELRQLRAAIPAETEKFLEAALNAHTAEISAALAISIDDLNRIIRKEEERTRLHYQELLGQHGASMLLKTCAMVLHVTIPTVEVEEWERRFLNDAQIHIDNGCSCTGCLTIIQGAGLGKVIDMTDPGTVLPDGATIVIDSREP